MIDWFGVCVAFILGSVIGSFLNVLIYRLPEGMSIVHPGSHCPRCGTALRPRDLVPLLSFLVQRCRCRYCKAPISWRYITVEFLTGAYFALLWIMRGPNFTTAESTSALLAPGVDFLGLAIFSAMLIAIFFVDLDHMIIPDELSLGAIALGILRDVIEIWIPPTGERAGEHLLRIAIPFTSLEFPMLRSIVGMLAFGAALLLIAEVGSRIYHRDAMGGGDIKLLAAFGANMAVGSVVIGFFAAVALGCLVGVALSAVHALRIKRRGVRISHSTRAKAPVGGGAPAAEKANRRGDLRESAFTGIYRKPIPALVILLVRRHIMPFGPMLVAGALAAQIWGMQIWDAYLRYVMNAS